MTKRDWALVLEVFRSCLSRRGDWLFLEAMHHFTVHNITWSGERLRSTRALPVVYGHWNSVWKRFSRLSRSGVFEAFFQALADLSPSAYLVQMFDST